MLHCASMNLYAAIISATVGVVTLVLAIFGASWLNQRYMGQLLEQMAKRFDARFDGLSAEIKRLDQRIDGAERQLNQRIEEMDQRLNQRISSVEQRIDFLDQRLDRIERQLDTIFKPS